MAASDVTIRVAGEADLDQIVAVGALALGWDASDPNTELFRWKHLENPFGPSLIWLAEIDGTLVGYRAFMRWNLIDATGRSWAAVRAVDTATHPEYWGQGIFSRLTSYAVEQVKAQGLDLVFNTPNAKSRPGYLRLGWVDVGRLPVAISPTSLASFVRVARARTPAMKWSQLSTVGAAATDMLFDSDLQSLIESQPFTSGLSTPLSVDLLQWRYGTELLHYRIWSPDGPNGGVVIFRIRRRGPARECVIACVLTPDADAAQARRLLHGLRNAVDADYILRIGASDLRAGFVSLPGQGPRLTARAAASPAPTSIERWNFQLGDIELF